MKETREEFLSGLPPHVRSVAERYPSVDDRDQYLCYRRRGHDDVHVIILEYRTQDDLELLPEYPVALHVLAGRGSVQAGLSATVRDPSELVRCGCGLWKPASFAEAVESLLRNAHAKKLEVN